jgi:hypothetical protein
MPVGMPVVVEAEDHHVVPVEEILLEPVGGVVFQRVGLIFMRVEGGFMGDHHILARRGGALHHVERRHHGGRNAFHLSIGRAGFDGVDRFGAPRYAHIFLNAPDDLSGGQRVAWLRVRQAERSRCRCSHEDPSRYFHAPEFIKLGYEAWLSGLVIRLGSQR